MTEASNEMATPAPPCASPLNFTGCLSECNAMKNATIIAIDLGKQNFHLHAQDDQGRELYHRKFSRTALTKHLAGLEPCSVVMEACGGSHFMAREVVRLGHTPKLI